MKKNIIYLHGLDHLRALAAFSVLFFHAIHIFVDHAYVPDNLFLSYLEEGYSGVALFMCITGFIFTYLISDKEVDYKKFLYNRFIRLFPLLFIASLFLSVVKYGVHGVDALTMLKFINLFGGGVVDVTWTLVIEVQFYLFFPILYVYFREHYQGKYKQYLPYLLLIVLAFFSRFAAYYLLNQTVQDVAYGTMFGRLDQFMFGVMAALLFRRINVSSLKPSAKYIGLAVAVISVLAIVVFQDYFNHRGGFFHLEGHPSPSRLWLFIPSIEGLLYSLMIIGWLSFTSFTHNLLSKVFTYLGKISYSTYLLHMPINAVVKSMMIVYGISFSADSFVNGTVATFILIYPVTILVSALSYELIEKPFLSKKVKYLFTR